MDEKTERRIRKLNERGLNYREIADRLGCGYFAVWGAARRMGLTPAGHKRVQYTIYDLEGNVRAFGTAEECAASMGVKLGTIYTYVSRSRRKKNKRAVRERF